MKPFILLLFLLSIFSNTVYAKVQASNEYTITAENLTYVPEKNRIFLRGNVIVSNDLFVVNAEEVDIILSAVEGDKAIAFTSESIKEILFRKNLHFTYDKKTTGKGENARFNVVKNTIVFSGNVVINSEGNIIEGDEVEVDITTQNTTVKGNRKKPVEILIKSKDLIK